MMLIIFTTTPIYYYKTCFFPNCEALDLLKSQRLDMKLLTVLSLLSLHHSTLGLLCRKQGKCVKSRWVIPMYKVNNLVECLKICKEERNEKCAYGTFYPASNGNWCYMYKDCNMVSVSDCPKCFTGHIDCLKMQCNLTGKCKVSTHFNRTGCAFTYDCTFF